MFVSSGEIGCQATRIEVELVLYPVMLAGATRGTGQEKNGKNEVRQIWAVNCHLKADEMQLQLLGI